MNRIWFCRTYLVSLVLMGIVMGSDVRAQVAVEIDQIEVNTDAASKKKTETQKKVIIAPDRYRMDITAVEKGKKALSQFVIYDGDALHICMPDKASPKKGSCFQGTFESLLNLSQALMQGLVETTFSRFSVKATGKSKIVQGHKCDVYIVHQDMKMTMMGGITSNVQTKDTMCVPHKSSGIPSPFKSVKIDEQKMKDIYQNEDFVKAAIRVGRLGVPLESTQRIKNTMKGGMASMFGAAGNGNSTKTLRTKSIKKTKASPAVFQVPDGYVVSELGAKK